MQGIDNLVTRFVRLAHNLETTRNKKPARRHLPVNLVYSTIGRAPAKHPFL